MRAPPWLPAVSAGLVAVLSAAVYAPVRRFDFVNFDDPRYVTEEPHVHAGLSYDTVAWAFGRTYDNSHPLTSLSHAAVWQVWGAAPAAHHVANVALHSLNAGLVVLALNALTRMPVRATAVALLFALHPLRVESVAWVTERKDVLSGAGFLLTLWAYASCVRRPSFGRRAWVLVAFAGALLAKPMVVTTPMVLLLLDWWPLDRRAIPIARRAREKLPLLLLAAVVGGVTIFVQRAGGAMASFQGVPLPARTANAVVANVRYLWLTAWPSGLAVFYPRHEWSGTTVVGAAGVLIIVTSLAFVARRRRPWIMVGWLWWLVMLLPVSGLLQVGEQSMADRFTYLPSLGLLVAVVWTVADVATVSAGRCIAATVCGAAVLASVGATRRQLATWRDSTTLFGHALAVMPDNYMAHLNLGQALAVRGNLAAARAHYEAALRSKPTDLPTLVNLGLAALRDGEVDNAEAYLRRVLAVRPDLPEAHNALALVHARRQDLPAAIAEYEIALAEYPDYVDAHANLAGVLRTLGRTDEAIQHYGEATRLRPERSDLAFELGNLLFERGRVADAVAAWRAALRERPEWGDARDNLAVGLLLLGRPGDAIPELERVVGEDPAHAPAQYHLGLALAAVGRRDAAIGALRAALQLRPEDAEAARALADLEAGP